MQIPGPSFLLTNRGCRLSSAAFPAIRPRWHAVDLEGFFAQIEHPRGIHLCGNPDWDFLLNLDIDILSFNAYNCGEIFVKYRDSIKRFLNKGGMLGWGLVPANQDEWIEGIDGRPQPSY